MRRILPILALLTVLAVVGIAPHAAQAAPQPYTGLVSLGMPSAPTPWHPADFAVVKHFRQTDGTTINGGYGPPADGGNEPYMAMHGPDCSAPPATHQVGQDYDSINFICHDHMMTAINTGSYGEINFQPAQLVDFSAGPATVSISVDTLVTSSRDWIDFAFVPFSEQLAVHTDASAAEFIKEPFDAVRLGQKGNGGFNLGLGEEIAGGVEHDLNPDWWTDVNSLIPASATTRTPITWTISKTHITEVMAGHTFLDTDFPVPLNFTQATFMAMHHSYNPTKDNAGSPNTWHWSNLTINSAVPYYLDNATPDAAGDYASLGLGSTIHFNPAPDGSFLRFEWFEYGLQGPVSGSVSFDGGATFVPLAEQKLAPITGIVANPEVHNIWQPVPQGATSAIFKGAGGWYARDFSVMSLNGGTPPPPTPTPPPGPTPTPIPPTPTPIPPTPTPIPPTPTPTSGAGFAGDKTVEAMADNDMGGMAEAFPVNASASGSVNAIHVYVDAGSAATGLVAGLYADNAGSPGALLAQGSLANPVASAWNTVAIPAVSLVSGTHYWLALLGTGGQLNFRDTANGGASYSSTSMTLSTLPATWAGTTAWPSAPVSAYAD